LYGKYIYYLQYTKINAWRIVYGRINNNTGVELDKQVWVVSQSKSTVESYHNYRDHYPFWNKFGIRKTSLEAISSHISSFAFLSL
jgi:hypothetical protein